LGLVEYLKEGEMFATSEDRGIILGSKLAENLDVELGKKVVYTVSDRKGEISSGLARVTGILETGATEVDSATCLLPIDSFREVLGYESQESTQIAVFLDSHRSADEVAARLDRELGEDVAVLPWHEALPDLAGFVTLKETGNIVLQLIITVLIAAGIFNTLFVSVMERMREFGILAAIGFSARQLFSLVLWESLWVALCGIVAGVLLTAGPYYYLNTEGIDYSALLGDDQAQIAGVTMSMQLYVELYPPHGLVIAAAIIIATLTAGLYPAFKAGRVEPVEVIRIV
jgi:ABC-type lipoprotein release transport system permease subunit